MEYKTFLEILALVLGSSAIAALVNAWFNRKKVAAEVETMVVSNYQKIVEDLQDEIKRLKLRVDEMDSREKLYIEQANLLLKENHELSLRVFQLEKDNKYLHEENQKLKKIINNIKNG